MRAPTDSSTRFRRSGLFLLAFVAVTVASIIGQTWWAIRQDKQLVLDAEAANGRVAVRLLENHASQAIGDALTTLNQVAQQSLKAVRGGQPTQLANLRRAIESHRLDNVAHLKTLQFVDPEGKVWIASTDVPAHFEDVSGRPYVRTLLANPDHREPLIGHSYTSRYDSHLVVPIAQNLYDQQQRRLGLISVDLRLEYFSSLYARVAKDNDASVALIANEGFVFVRSPFEARYLDRDISDEPSLRTIISGETEGSFIDEHFLDDELARLYIYKKISDLPITAVYGRDLDLILGPWKQRSRDRILFSSGTVALIVSLTFFLQLYIRRLGQSRRSLQESEAKFIGFFRSSPVPMVIVRQSDNTLSEVNDAWLRLFGYKRDEVLDKTARDLNIWIDYEARRYLGKQLEQGVPVVSMDATLRTKTGESLVCMLSAKTFTSGKDGLIIMTVVDVTIQRGIEQEIRELNLELEDRVASRTKNLEDANRNLSDALKSVKAMQNELIRSEKMAALGSLVAGVSHELNTPIGTSVTVASAIHDETAEMKKTLASGPLKKSMLEKYVENIGHGMEILLSSLGRASDLIGSFKQVAVDQSSNYRRKFKLNVFLQELLLTLEPLYRKTPYKLSTALAANVEMDSYPGPLGQIITNLVSNAIMHAFDDAPQGKMYLAVRTTDETHIEISFSDDGKGIPEEHLTKIFDPFFTTKFGQGGSGLGMNIAYNLTTEVLGGTITVTSEVGHGTTFILRLPCAAPVAPNTVEADA